MLSFKYPLINISSYTKLFRYQLETTLVSVYYDHIAEQATGKIVLTNYVTIKTFPFSSCPQIQDALRFE